MSKTYVRHKENAIFGGVCSGLAAYIESSPSVVRAIFILSFFFFSMVSVPIYFALWLIFPSNNVNRPDSTFRRTVFIFSLSSVFIISLIANLSLELPGELTLGSALIIVGLILLALPGRKHQETLPAYAPSKVISNKKSEELDLIDQQLGQTNTQ